MQTLALAAVVCGPAAARESPGSLIRNAQLLASLQIVHFKQLLLATSLRFKEALL